MCDGSHTIHSNPHPAQPVHVQHEHLCVKKATEPKSPMLATKTRGQQYRRVLEEKLDREAALIKAQAEFHARPILEPAQPFVPSHPERPALENQPFHLNTETRSLNRKAFEEEVRQHEKEVELWKKKQQAEDQV